MALGATGGRSEPHISRSSPDLEPNEVGIAARRRVLRSARRVGSGWSHGAGWDVRSRVKWIGPTLLPPQEVPMSPAMARAVVASPCALHARHARNLAAFTALFL